MSILFIDVLGKVFPKFRMQEIAEGAQLNQTETELFIGRCADGMTVNELIDFGRVTASQQRALIRVVNNKVQIWMDWNYATVLKPKELRMLHEALRKYNLPPPGMEDEETDT